MDHAQINNIFEHHAPNATQRDRYAEIRSTARQFAHLINEHCPESREKSLAITSLQQAMMWANASIAINEPPV